MENSNTQKKEKLFRDFVKGKINRRTFIVLLASFGGGYALSEFLPNIFQSIDRSKTLTTRMEKVLKEVLRHLFPATETSPGSDEINALIYLQLVLLDPQLDPRDQKFIINSVNWLEEECQKLFSSSFTNLDSAEKEQVLRAIENENWGERWLSYLLKYIFEALLTDPIYSGNPNSMGWEWLGHIPGQPRPNPANRYGETA